jgi:hypothetical protein
VEDSDLGPHTYPAKVKEDPVTYARRWSTGIAGGVHNCTPYSNGAKWD